MTKTQTYNSLFDMFEYFSDKQTCIKHLEKIRWKDGNVACVFCGNDKVYRTKAGYKCAAIECNKNFTVTVGTIFEGSNIPLKKWFIAMYLCSIHKKGYSGLQLARVIKVTQKTAWFMIQRINEMFREKGDIKLSGIIELDETFIGGKAKNKHYSKRIKGVQGRGTVGKFPVLGMLERKGKIVLTHIPDVNQWTIHPLIRKYIEPKSILMTDEAAAYRGLTREYTHHYVEHYRKQYAIGDITTNSIEGFWPNIKRSIMGVHHKLSEKHLQSYCHGYEFRFNTRHLEQHERFDKALSQCEGRLKYKDLIKEKRWGE